MKKLTLISVSLLLIILIALSGCAKTPSANIVKQKETITIGVIGPLTGDYADYGQDIKRAIEISLRDINSVGNYKFELIYEDSGACDATKGVNAINKLININQVDAVIGLACSNVALAISPIAEQNQKLLMLTTESNYKIKNAGDYIFRVYPSDSFQGKKLAEITNKDNIKTIATIYKNVEYAIGLKETFTQNYKGKILTSETYNPETKDFRTIVTKIKAKNPEGIIIFEDDASNSGLILNEIKRLIPNAKIYASDATKDSLTLEIAGESAEGLITLFPALPENSKYKLFEKTYERFYNKKPESYASYGYDVLKLLTETIEKVGRNTDKIKQELYSTKDYQGVTGTIGFDEFGERIDISYNTFIVQDGQFVEI